MACEPTPQGKGITGRQWYAVRCKPRQEFIARHEFEQQDFEVYLPLERKLRRHARKMEKVPRPFFSGYLFLHLAQEECRWTAIRSTRGAVCAVHFGPFYPPVPDAVMEMLRQFEDEDGYICEGDDPISPFKPGERVIMHGGQFSGIEGVFVCRDGQERAHVLLDMLQRKVRTNVALQELKSA